jgi:hypothetical protein
VAALLRQRTTNKSEARQIKLKVTSLMLHAFAYLVLQKLENFVFGWRKQQIVEQETW